MSRLDVVGISENQLTIISPNDKILPLVSLFFGHTRKKWI